MSIVSILKKIHNNHPDYSKMALLLCKIIPATTRDVHLQHATKLYFPFGLLRDLFLRFPNANN